MWFKGAPAMDRIILDQTIWSILRKATDDAELCDAAGRVVGYFTPSTDPALYAGVESPTSPDELLRRKQEGGGRPLADILRDLENGT
jgi:hypothetical protein